jgi:cysteine desulfurase
MDPSHVLAAMGVSREMAGGAVRLSLGWASRDEDVDRVLEVMPAAVSRLQPERPERPERPGADVGVPVA